MSLTKLSLDGNNLTIPAQGEFGQWLVTGKSLTSFYSVRNILVCLEMTYKSDQISRRLFRMHPQQRALLFRLAGG